MQPGLGQGMVSLLYAVPVQVIEDALGSFAVAVPYCAIANCRKTRVFEHMLFFKRIQHSGCWQARGRDAWRLVEHDDGYIAWIGCGISYAPASCRTAVREEYPLLFLLE